MIQDIGSFYYSTAKNLRAENTLQDAAKNQRNDKLYQACEDFEAIFIKQMLSSMRKTVNKSGLFDGGFAEEIYEDMLYDEYAAKMASSTRLGIAEMLYKQLNVKSSV